MYEDFRNHHTLEDKGSAPLYAAAAFEGSAMHDLPADWSALCAVVILLGLKHDFDADHLATWPPWTA